MFEYDSENSLLLGTHGSLSVPTGDQAALKMAIAHSTEIGHSFR